MAKPVTNFTKIQLVLEDDEQFRFETLYKRAQERQPYTLMTTAPIVRRLLGLVEPDALITQDDIDFFQGKKVKTNKVIKDVEVVDPEQIARQLKGKSAKKKVG